MFSFSFSFFSLSPSSTLSTPRLPTACPSLAPPWPLDFPSVSISPSSPSVVALSGPGTPYDAPGVPLSPHGAPSPSLRNISSASYLVWLLRLPRDSLNLQFQVASNATTTTGRPLPLYILHIINYQSLPPPLSLSLSLHASPPFSIPLLPLRLLFPSGFLSASTRATLNSSKFRRACASLVTVAEEQARRLAASKRDLEDSVFVGEGGSRVLPSGLSSNARQVARWISIKKITPRRTNRPPARQRGSFHCPRCSRSMFTDWAEQPWSWAWSRARAVADCNLGKAKREGPGEVDVRGWSAFFPFFFRFVGDGEVRWFDVQ